MRATRVAAFLLLLFFALVVGRHFRRTGPASETRPTAAGPAQNVSRPSGAAIGGVPAAELAEQRRETLARLAYAQQWDGPLPAAEFTAFREWTERYRHTAPAARPALEAEGVALARARRPEMKRFIMLDPSRALALTVPAAVRQELPAAVRAELETRVAGRGDFTLLAALAAPGEAEVAAERRIVWLDGVTYAAHAYGRREGQLTKEGASLHGIALDGEFALHESPLRVLEPGEIPAGTAAAECPVSSLPVAPLVASAGVNLGAPDVVEALGRVFEFCGGEGMLKKLEDRLTAAEDRPGSRVEALVSGDSPVPPTAADAPSSRTVGAQRVLVIRVDFSDIPGDPITEIFGQLLMDGGVKSFFEESSYGQTTLTTTISPKVYRLPQTASSYALGGSDSQLHIDARALAAADYTLANFDRIVVAFVNIGTSRFSGSRITFAGEASVGGSSVWINGSFTQRILTHELGHTYGLKHANLWQVLDGNPVSNNGTSVEYKDPFDAMGDASTVGAQHHYTMWSKNRLGWLPDSAVTNVATSGTYRVYRFDSKNSPTQQPLALRVFRDGVRSYWVGYRQNFTTNSSLTNGAYVTWGTNSLQQTHLLDLTTPGTSNTDAALGLGATFSDPTYGVTIKPVARGGADPAQWLDVEITVPPVAPPNVVAAWGREGAFFYDTAGVPIVPAPETAVPLNLTGVRAIAAGATHALALKADGTVAAWGSNTLGESTVPAGLGNVIAISAGGSVSGALKADGTLQLWGDATFGQTTVPAGLSGVRQFAIGTTHVLALKSDGTVVAWGSNSSGQTTIPAGLAGVTAIAAGNASGLALKSDGTIVTWAGSATFRAPPAGLSGVIAIAAGGTHGLALKSDGTVVAWGNNLNGQATVPAGLNNVVSIAAGDFHSLALKSDGTVVGWGSTGSGKLNIPPGLTRSYAIDASAQGSLALTGSHLFVTVPPEPVAAVVGGSATLSVTATSAGAIGYQWRKNGVAIAGATGSTLTLGSVAAGDAGSYDVVVADAGSTIAVSPVALSVAPASDVSRISNISIRVVSGPDAKTLIVGFFVSGGAGATKPLLLRGAGPSLAPYGVTGFLADPQVALYSGAKLIARNDNWGGDAQVTNIGAQVGAFPFVALSSRDSAIYNAALPSGGYSLQVSGADGSSGVALAEVYDASPNASFTPTTPRLVNVSARTECGTGGDIIIAGFFITGTVPKKVLVRAIGPTLADFGVTGALANPTLGLYTGSTKIAENDDWGGTSALASAFASVAAFALPPASRDSALQVTLPPGGYSAQISGVGGTTGVALVEIYELP